MRELKVVGLDADGKNIICQGAIPSEQFKLPVDDRLRAALRDDSVQPEQAQLDIEVTNVLSPKEIQARIRAGASVEQVAAASGSDIARIRRFAHPVLLERSRAAELATAAHPVLADGPAVLTMQETVAAALVARGLNPDSLTWDAWRNEDSRWTVQLAWKAGRSDNLALAPVAHLDFDEPEPAQPTLTVP
ncbi:septation protein SepH, partial [Mycobacterium tuberculosis]|uniref:septation protein SepH n=1 Tax=Mycobacterium tuberculosis TaxID=1773 RepID=UPI00045B10D6